VNDRPARPRVRPCVRLCAHAIVPLWALLAVACGGGPRPGAVTPAADSAAAAARRDSVAAAVRRDSVASAAERRDSIAAAAQADTLARAARETARADSVRAQVQAEAAAESAAVLSGLDSASTAELSAVIHFDLDRSDLTDASVAALDRKLRILQANPRLEIQIAGHCDERGSDEYNLALGSRRAAAAKRYLVEHGISEGRIGIVSYGEERPLDPGGTEEAWARNRRDEFAVTVGAR
jgi:peptidoglycan-associated lipoprotein